MGSLKCLIPELVFNARHWMVGFAWEPSSPREYGYFAIAVGPIGLSWEWW